MLVATVRTVVVTDTSILINFLHTGHLWLLGRLPGFRFVIPDEVIAEIAQADQQQIIAEAMAAGHVQRESISSLDELALFAELRQVLGAGESSCLTLAEKRGWIVACDEKRVFLREATRRLGAGRILNTPGIAC